MVLGNQGPDEVPSYGGGVCVYDCTTGTLTNNVIAQNSAFYGGGVHVDGYTTGTLTNNVITQNSGSVTGNGLGLYLRQDDHLSHIYNKIIRQNTGPEGKDLYIQNDGNGNFIPSTVYLFNNDFDQSAAGTYMEVPFVIDPSNLDNEDPPKGAISTFVLVFNPVFDFNYILSSMPYKCWTICRQRPKGRSFSNAVSSAPALFHFSFNNGHMDR